MASKFFAFLYRMRYIARWSLMRNTRIENLAEHSFDVATLAHCLALIRRDVFGKQINPEQVAACALYHDTSEILTGDLPTPIKYMNPDIRTAYQDIEKNACKTLLSHLPQALQPGFDAVLRQTDAEVAVLVKAADKLSAYLKCVEERKAGNQEFVQAEKQTRAALERMNLAEVDYFLETFAPAYDYTLDELNS